jgi:HEAT repeat protein
MTADSILFLIEKLAHPDWEQAKQASAALIKHGAEALPALIDALDSEDDTLRAGAASALEAIGDPRAIPALVAALRPDSPVRQPFIFALGSFGAGAVPALAEALLDPITPVQARIDLAEALGRTDCPEAAAALHDALGDPDPAIRAGAANGLGWMLDPAARDPLLRALDDPDRTVRLAAAAAVEWRAYYATPYTGGLPGLVENPAAYLIETAAPVLQKALNDPDVEVRLSGATGLRWARPVSAVAALITALTDDDESVREGALTTLEEIATPEALAALEGWDAPRNNSA